MTQTLTTPITGDQLRTATLLTAEVRTATGRVIIPSGKLNWALTSHEGDHDGLAYWANCQAGR